MDLTYLVLPLWLVFFTFAFYSKTMAYQEGQVKRDVDEMAVEKARNAFAFNMYKELLKENRDRNIFFSPYSISSAMSMLLLGARGKTEGELKKGLAFGGLTDIHEQNRKIREAIAGVNGVVLSTANRLFPDDKFEILSEYKSNCEKYYGSDVESLNFAGDAEGSRKKINDWVLEQTKDKIEDLLQPGSVTGDTLLVLANAIYFKGNWAKQFDPRGTRKKDFHISAEKVTAVDMMYRKARFHVGVSEEFKAQVLHLPYEGNSTSMVIILPDERFGLGKIETALEEAGAAKKLLKTRTFNEEIVLDLPKFRMEFGSDLVKPFMQLGVTSIFGGSADFSGIADTNNLFVSAIAHKAFVEVNEEGTEAAAATAVVMTRMALLPPRTFTCDHPFLFFIMHKDLILFAGRYVNPSA